MGWMRLYLVGTADSQATMPELLQAFATVLDAEQRPRAAALFARAEAEAWTVYAMGVKAPAIAEVLARFRFEPCGAPRPAGMRLLLGHPDAARVLTPDPKGNPGLATGLRSRQRDRDRPDGRNKL